jgi:hypothetical protein
VGALAVGGVCVLILPGAASVKAQEPAAAPASSVLGPAPAAAVDAAGAPAATSPAPPHAAAAPTAAPAAAASQAAAPPGPAAGAASTPTASPKPPPEPLKRPRFDAAILQGVDKITAETLRFEVKVGEPVRYKGLILTVHACEGAAADEAAADSIAHLEVQSQPEVLPGRVAAAPRLVFRGWMFASSPTLHPFEHPVYDLWLIACKTAAPSA